MTDFSMKKSASEDWREQGNAKYKAAQDDSVNAVLRRGRMGEAQSFYQKAYDVAETEDEKASAAKNLGLSYWKIVPIMACASAKFSEVQYYYKQGLTFLDKARQHGNETKAMYWKSTVFAQLISCYEEAVHGTHRLTYRQRIGYIEQYINCLLETPFKAECYINMGSLIFKEGVSVLVLRNDYRTGLHCMKECHRPIEEARRLAGGSAFVNSEVNILEADVFMNMCTAESLQARQMGDEFLEKALRQEEVLLMTGVYTAMDYYRSAIILTREHEVEMEAIANCRLAVVYDKVIKRKDKAHRHFKHCLDLAYSLAPKNFAKEEWYQKAIEALRRYQEEQLKQENEEWNKNRVKYFKELSEELIALNDAEEKGMPAYLLHIYKCHPPKNPDHHLHNTTEEYMRQNNGGVMKKAIIHYHPDLQKEHGEKWLVICEEITKILTKHY